MERKSPNLFEFKTLLEARKMHYSIPIKREIKGANLPYTQVIDILNGLFFLFFFPFLPCIPFSKLCHMYIHIFKEH